MIESVGQKIELSDGNMMPGFGFGCYKAEGEVLIDAIKSAYEVGYRFFDTAAFYENEEDAGRAFRSLPREKIFVLSKIWPSAFENPVAALDASLKALGLDYLDAYLLHWPGLEEKKRINTYEALMKERSKGKIRVLGTSNFTQKHLENLRERCGEWPPVNQIEVHPFFPQKDLCGFCEHRFIQVISWSPLGRGAGFSNPVIVKIAEELGKSPAQILLRWQIQKNYAPIPKSTHPERIRENADIFNFTLSPDQMIKLNSLALPNDAGRIGKDPDSFPEV